MIKKILLVFIGLVQTTIILSQTYYFDNYSVQDGLGQSTVYDIIQDQNGFLWLGTKSGVSKFNGLEFINYTTEDGLAENGVTSIHEDNKGIIWFGHLSGGLSRYYRGKFQHIDHKSFEYESRITAISEDSKGNIWVGSDGSGALKVSNTTSDSVTGMRIETVRGKEGLGNRIATITTFTDGTICFVMNVGMKIYDPELDSFDHFKPRGLSVFSQITTLFEDDENNLWVGSFTNGLQYYNRAKKKTNIFFKRNGLAENFISCIAQDHDGNIWIGTWGGGISKYSRGKFKNYNTNNGLPDNKIWDIMVDREGNVIIGSNENGLAIYKGDQFVSYSKQNGLINNQVWAITQDQSGNFWFGTNKGISILNPSDTQLKFTQFTLENGHLPSNQVRFLKVDDFGTLWLGTSDYNVWEYQAENDFFKYNTIINRYFPPDLGIVTAMEIDRDNNLWVGTVEGLIYYEIENQKSALLTQNNGIQGNDISAIHCDKDGIVWVGSRGRGLARIEDTDIRAIDLGGSYTPASIASDGNGQLWIGTEGQGLLMLNRENDSITHITTKDGLLSNFITLVDVDKNNQVYIGTNLGLNKYNPENAKISTYTEKSGFVGIEVKNNASYIDDEGNIWFGTINGAIKFNLAKEKYNSLEPLTHIQNLMVNQTDREMVPNLKLKHTEKSIRFDFAAVCLTNPDKIQFQYKLLGADEHWNPPTRQDHVTYSPLPPGKYTFLLKASNNEGIWNEEPVSYSFKIRPPFWKTVWFYLIIGFIIINSIIAYIRIRTKNLIREKRILEEKVALRTKEVVAQKEQIEKEKEKSEELLLNTLPLKVVNELKETGKTIPDNFKNVTVFFSDIVSFTKKSAVLEPKILIDELNDIFTAFDDIMTRHACERLKTIGDAYLAVCGMPEENPDNAEKILQASMDILKYIEKRNRTSKYNWTIRVGVHTGPVVGGVVGVRKYIYDVFGDTINTASRMESNSEPMKINVSEQTYKQAKEKFEFIKREAIEVKGKGKMNMYFVKI